MNESHKQACNNASTEGCEQIYPQIILIHFAIESERVHVANLISCLCEAKCRVEASTTYRSSELNHRIKSRCYCPSLDHSISAILSASEYLTENAQSEKERAPELKQKYFKPLSIIVQETSSATVKWTEECRLSNAEVAHYNAEVCPEDLETDYHQYQLQVVEQSSFSDVDCDCYCRVEHST